MARALPCHGRGWGFEPPWPRMPTSESKYSNKEIAHLLRSIAAVYTLKKENIFKIIAYQNAATGIEYLTREIKDIWQDGRLDGVPGIGPSIRSSLDEYFAKGYSKHFESILKRVPATVFVLMKIPSIGPMKAFKLVTAFKLNDVKTVVQDLKKIAKDGRIAELPTFGKKSEQDIIEAISRFENNSNKVDRMPLPYAFTLAEDIKKYLSQLKEVKRVDALGSLRRMVATIGDIDLAVIADGKDAKKIVEYFIAYPKKIGLYNSGDKKASILVSPHIRVDLRVQEEDSYGAMLQYFTGSKAHNVKLREYALTKGFSLSEYGIKNLKAKNQNIKKYASEEKFYSSLGLEHVPPELREGTWEIELAKKNSLPKLVTLTDIKGDMHLHSSYPLKPSHDAGVNSYQEICVKAKNLGYEYVGFADHNPKYTDLSEIEIVDLLKKRQSHIRKNIAFPHFIGLEVDILPDGSLALPEKAIDHIDYLIISVHSVFEMSVAEMTTRVLRALSHPKVKVLGHPTGRLLGKREGFEMDWTEIFKFCASSNIAIEINSWPQRLDLPDSLVNEAKNLGVKFMINTDAHENSQMENMFYGVSVARRGWCKKNDIINSLPFEKFKNWLERR